MTLIKHFYKFILILSINTFLVACVNNSNEKSFDGIPNSKTNKISIETKNMPDQVELLNSLKAKLEENEFNIEEQEVTFLPGFSNCEDNTTIQMEGKGIRSYFARSRKPEKNTEDFYPDFTIQVFEFPSEQIAQEKFEIMNKALHSDGRFCNGKAPQILVINKNEVFQFLTRAEMFRGYINEYSEFVQNY